MNINLHDIDLDNFIVKPGMVGDEQCYLVIPQHIGCQWNKRNLHFRSSMWNKNGDPVSLSFPKFFNWKEQPELAYNPQSLTGCQIISKEDGSTLIVSKYKNQLVIRTRGTFDARALDNGHEVNELIERYPLAFDNDHLDHGYSLLFEWLSPTNRIVIKHDDVDMKLIGIIDHSDYKMLPQHTLDIIATSLKVPRPMWYDFDTISNMIDAVEAFTASEGVCVYCNGGQTIRKLKSVSYLTKHKLKNELSNFDKLLDFCIRLDDCSFGNMYSSVMELTDYETAEELKGDISRIVDGLTEVTRIIDHMNKFVVDRQNLTRKQIALDIKQAYGNTNRCGYVFNVLDSKPIPTDGIKKMIYQVLK